MGRISEEEEAQRAKTTGITMIPVVYLQGALVFKCHKK